MAEAMDPEALGSYPNRKGRLSCFERRRRDLLGHSRTHWVLGEDRPGDCKGSRGDPGSPRPWPSTLGGGQPGRVCPRSLWGLPRGRGQREREVEAARV